MNSESGHKEVALAHVAYGNEASLGWDYSYGAIFINIASRAERMKELAGKETKDGKGVGGKQDMGNEQGDTQMTEESEH